MQPTEEGKFIIMQETTSPMHFFGKDSKDNYHLVYKTEGMECVFKITSVNDNVERQENSTMLA